MVVVSHKTDEVLYTNQTNRVTKRLWACNLKGKELESMTRKPDKVVVPSAR